MLSTISRTFTPSLLESSIS